MAVQTLPQSSVILDEYLEDVPDDLKPLFVSLTTLTDAFCDEHLNDEYKDLCRELAVEVCQKGTPAVRGKPQSWAAGITYALGHTNFLSDPNTTPYMASVDVAKGFGVSEATMHRTAGILRKDLELGPLNLEWCLPSRLADHPLAFMVEINGFIVDARWLPRETQIALYEAGMIPILPSAPFEENGLKLVKSVS